MRAAPLLLLCLFAVAVSAKYGYFAEVVTGAAEHASPEEKEVLWKFATVCAGRDDDRLKACHDVLTEDELPIVKIISLAKIIHDYLYFPRGNANFAAYAESVAAVNEIMWKDAFGRILYDDIAPYWRKREALWAAAFECAKSPLMQDCHAILLGDSKDKVQDLTALVLRDLL